jgi:hypothetical protein
MCWMLWEVQYKTIWWSLSFIFFQLQIFYNSWKVSRPFNDFHHSFFSCKFNLRFIHVLMTFIIYIFHLKICWMLWEEILQFFCNFLISYYNIVILNFHYQTFNISLCDILIQKLQRKLTIFLKHSIKPKP